MPLLYSKWWRVLYIGLFGSIELRENQISQAFVEVFLMHALYEVAPIFCKFVLLTLIACWPAKFCSFCRDKKKWPKKLRVGTSANPSQAPTPLHLHRPTHARKKCSPPACTRARSMRQMSGRVRILERRVVVPSLAQMHV